MQGGARNGRPVDCGDTEHRAASEERGGEEASAEAGASRSHRPRPALGRIWECGWAIGTWMGRTLHRRHAAHRASRTPSLAPRTLHARHRRVTGMHMMGCKHGERGLRETMHAEARPFPNCVLCWRLCHHQPKPTWCAAQAALGRLALLAGRTDGDLCAGIAWHEKHREWQGEEAGIEGPGCALRPCVRLLPRNRVQGSRPARWNPGSQARAGLGLRTFEKRGRVRRVVVRTGVLVNASAKTVTG